MKTGLRFSSFAIDTHFPLDYNKFHALRASMILNRKGLFL